MNFDKISRSYGELLHGLVVYSDLAVFDVPLFSVCYAELDFLRFYRPFSMPSLVDSVCG